MLDSAMRLRNSVSAAAHRQSGIGVSGMGASAPRFIAASSCMHGRPVMGEPCRGAERLAGPVPGTPTLYGSPSIRDWRRGSSGYLKHRSLL